MKTEINKHIIELNTLRNKVFEAFNKLQLANTQCSK